MPTTGTPARCLAPASATTSRAMSRCARNGTATSRSETRAPAAATSTSTPSGSRTASDPVFSYLFQQPLPERSDGRALGDHLGAYQPVGALRPHLDVERRAQPARSDVGVDQRLERERHPQLLRRRFERQDVRGEARAAAAVDALVDLRRFQPLSPGVAAGDEV